MGGEATPSISALALCWRIDRSDGAGLALTSHDQDLLHGGVSYRAEAGMLPSAISKNAGVEPTSGEVAGALRTDALTEQDLALGRWDQSRLRLIAADWSDPAIEAIHLGDGELGEVSTDGGSFSVELRGAASRLAGPVCPSTSPECRAQLGDKSCRIDLAGRRVRASVLALDGATILLDRELDERHLFGRLRYLSGANCGLSTIVLAVSGGQVSVRDLPRADIEPGCVIEVREGCDKRFETCGTRFNNAVNFRGEPHLPGNDLLTRYPGA